MKRRKFIQNLSLGIAPTVIRPIAVAAETNPMFPRYEHRQPQTLQEALTRDGQIIIRLEFISDDRFKILISMHLFRK